MHTQITSYQTIPPLEMISSGQKRNYNHELITSYVQMCLVSAVGNAQCSGHQYVQDVWHGKATDITPLIYYSINYVFNLKLKHVDSFPIWNLIRV